MFNSVSYSCGEKKQNNECEVRKKREVLRAGLMKYDCYRVGRYKIEQIQTDIAV